MTFSSIDMTAIAPQPSVAARVSDYARRHPTVVVGGGVLFLMALIAIFAPWIANDPMTTMYYCNYRDCRVGSGSAFQ